MSAGGTALPLLTVEDLSIDARTPEGLRPVLEGVSFALEPGETLCLAGESGSGKSLTALAIMRLLSPSLKVRRGRITLAGRDLTALSDRAYRSVRGRIESSWKRQNEKFTLDVTIPPGATASVYLPATAMANVKESGKPVDSALGVTFLRTEGDRALLTIGSGIYHFSSTVAVTGGN